jgi:DNA repair exonuclease SbcCD ATPase subunit
MADNLTRKLLSSMGIDQDKIDGIIEAHASTVDALKDARAELEALRTENEQLKKAGGDYAAEKDRADKAEKALADYKALAAASEKRGKVRDAYRALLQAAHVDEKRQDTILKVTDLDKLSLKADGTLDGADQLSESIRTEWADFINTQSTAGSNPATPPGGTRTEDDAFAAIAAAMGIKKE